MSELVRPVAFVTGSSRGIGRACAVSLAQEGFNLVIHGRSSNETSQRLESLSRELSDMGAETLILQGEISDRSFREHAFDEIRARFNRLDCMVNNAGTASLRRGDLLEVKEDSYDHCQDVNTKAMFFMCQQAALMMLKQEPIKNFALSIINITSCSAGILSVSRGDYCISKAAASMVSRLFALRLAKTAVRVFEIRPGIIETDMTSVVSEKYTNLIANGLVPEGRWGVPDDIAKSVVAIALGSMPFTVGQIINVDGGLYLHNF